MPFGNTVKDPMMTFVENEFAPNLHHVHVGVDEQWFLVGAYGLLALKGTNAGFFFTNLPPGDIEQVFEGIIFSMREQVFPGILFHPDRTIVCRQFFRQHAFTR